MKFLRQYQWLFLFIFSGMKKHILLIGCFLIGLLFSCKSDDEMANSGNPLVQECPNTSIESKIIIQDGITYLYGGDSDTMHFNVSNWNFDKCRLKLGLGREVFPALSLPGYTNLADVNYLQDNDSCLIINDGDVFKVFPFSILTYHEAVNENINDSPVLIAYCKLADLAVVYNREICNEVLDFAIAGYTYSQEDVLEDLRSFVIWDRQTESLWWPLSDIGVSGFFKNRFLEKYTETQWTITSWNDIKENYNNVLVLHTQDPVKPEVDLQIPIESIDCN
jgi:uncharacterized protein DUF3179